MNTVIRVSGIIKESIVDGPGIRLVVFAQGCKHNCKGCHNPHTHSLEGGTEVSIESILESIHSNPLLDGITLSGGEPFLQAERFVKLVKRVKQMGLHVMVYTGYTYDEILKNCNDRPGWRELLEQADILVDGRFEWDKRNLMLRFKGSENQRIIDIKKSRINNEIIEACI